MADLTDAELGQRSRDLSAIRGRSQLIDPDAGGDETEAMAMNATADRLVAVVRKGL